MVNNSKTENSALASGWLREKSKIMMEHQDFVAFKDFWHAEHKAIPVEKTSLEACVIAVLDNAMTMASALKKNRRECSWVIAAATLANNAEARDELTRFKHIWGHFRMKVSSSSVILCTECEILKSLVDKAWALYRCMESQTAHIDMLAMIWELLLAEKKEPDTQISTSTSADEQLTALVVEWFLEHQWVLSHATESRVGGQSQLIGLQVGFWKRCHWTSGT